MAGLRSALATLAMALALATPAVAAAQLRVAVDPGHGGADTGAIGVLAPGTDTGLPPRTDDAGRTVIYEKDVTLDVAQRLAAWLGARGYPVVLTRTEDLAGGNRPYTTELADLRARVAIANRAGADLLVSIHENAFIDPAIRGTETYHYTLAGAPARALAVAIHQELVLRLGLADRGVASAGFYVLKHTVMPAVLVEGAFLTNPDEAALLARPDVRQSLAEGIGAGVDVYAHSDAPGLVGQPAPAAEPLFIRYRVTAGRFRRRADALERAAALRRRSVEAVIRRRYTPSLRRTLFHVVTGQFVFLDNARAQRD
ncbi:MAG: N-acetylmuramoyl-L-alanine amidase, partial [Miltoncostaeaceae bacterium]|nr:N-acetylmuramoyl-L-alanine amidase [Miltoncostaeaceae bacterium]